VIVIEKTAPSMPLACEACGKRKASVLDHRPTATDEDGEPYSYGKFFVCRPCRHLTNRLFWVKYNRTHR